MTAPVSRTQPAVPPLDATTADDALVGRGARHVRIGLALEALATVAMATIAARSMGPGAGLGLGGWIGAAVMQGVLVAALLSGSRIARGFLLLSGITSAIGACVLLGARTVLPATGVTAELPSLFFGLCVAASSAGSLLATATPAARAWFRARRAALAAKRKPKSLDEWRRR
jgi:hypothetical protein